MAVHDLLKGREYNRNKAMEGFDPRIARAVHQNRYADVLLRPTMVGILRCGKMLPPQLNLVLKIEFADGCGPRTPGRTRRASQVVLDSALVESFNRALLSGRRVPRVQQPHGAHAAVHGASGRGGAQRHRRTRLHETHGSVRDFLGQRRGL